MKVYFVGAHSTGKTTLARYVAKKHKLPILPEIARQVMTERETSMQSMRVDMDEVDSFQSTIFRRQLETEKEFNHGEFVSDRGFDNLAYAAQHSNILRRVLESQEMIDYVSALRSDVHTIIFFVRPSKDTIYNDGVRDTNWEGIVQIDAMVKFMLEAWGLKYFTIATSSMQERTRLVDAVIDARTVSC